MILLRLFRSFMHAGAALLITIAQCLTFVSIIIYKTGDKPLLIVLERRANEVENV